MEGFGKGFMDFINGIEAKVEKQREDDYVPRDYQFSDGEGVEEADLLGDSGSDQAGWSDDDDDAPKVNKASSSTKKVTFAEEEDSSGEDDFDDEEAEFGEDEMEEMGEDEGEEDNGSEELEGE